MFRQIKLISKIQLLGVFGINEAVHSNDKKLKKRNLSLAAMFVFIGLMIAGYSGGLSYAYVKVGLSDIIPIYLSAVTSIVILMFTIIKAGDTVFNMKTYENLIVLPVRQSAIVASRFFVMYVFNVAMSLLIFLPTTVIYGMMLKSDISFYIMMILGAVFMPLIPMSVATALGGLIYGLSSRLKHKNIAIIILSFAVTFALIVAPMLLADKSSLTEVQLAQMTAVMFQKIGSIFPPAILFSNAVIGKNPIYFLLFCLMSLALSALFTALIGYKFKAICTALQGSPAKRNYVMENQNGSSQLKALYNKELKRYFASSIYVLNTSMGYILTVIMSVAALILGIDKINQMFVGMSLPSWAFSFVLGAFFSMAPTTTCSISIEGKQWWLVKSLPISTKTVLDSKLLVNLTIALPCYLISVISLLIALKPSAFEMVWLVVLPLIYLLFSSVAGLTVNMKNPMFNWESETVAVKQSKAVLLSMLVDLVAVGAPVALLILLPQKISNLILAATAVLLIAITCMLYTQNNKIELSKID